MKFSVLIPVYNVEKYVAEAIESVLSQEFFDYEIIIIDDGSSDRSESIYRSYTEKYPEKIKAYKQENKGQLAARVHAIKKSDGDYCMFLDADDIYVENVFSILSDAISKNNYPDMVIFPFYYDRNGVLEKSKSLCEKNYLYQNAELKGLYEEFNNGTLLNNVWTKAIRRDIAEKSTIGYEKFVQLRCSEDRYQSMMMFKSVKSVLYITTPLYRYRLFEGSITRQYTRNAVNRFNVSSLYDFEDKCYREWKMDSAEWKNRIDASRASYPLYVMKLFYNKVKKSDRKNILRYDWKSFLPDNISMDGILSNPQLGKVQKRVWSWINDKKFMYFRVYFLQTKIYQKVRYIKRKLFR